MTDSRPHSPDSPAAVHDLTGTTVGRFRIHTRLGAGGMGEVYAAEDTMLKRTVAVKRMDIRLRDDETSRKRFLKEAERASKLNDPNIAGLYDILEQDGELFLVMEYIEGQTLRLRIERPFTVEEFLDLAAQSAHALVAAHDKGILHRDIKPENIMLTAGGRVKVLDFGVAREVFRGDETPTATTDSSIGSSGSLSGTLAYMAPEVLLSRESDERADLFSLGIVLYETFTGRHPFRGESFISTSDKILHAEHEAVCAVRHDAPGALENIFTKLLAKKPEERYATAADLLVDLRAIQRGTGAGLKGVAPPPPRPRLSARAQVAVALALVVVSVASFYALRPGATHGFGERDWLLITDIENTTGDAQFDTLNTLLASALQQSHYVNVVPRVQAFEAARRTGRDAVVSIDTALGREICLREGYRAALTGRVEQAGGGYLIRAELMDPNRARIVVSESETLKSAAELYAGVDRLARRLRESLGESLAQIESTSTPLEQVTTSSLAALERYTRAVSAYANGEWQKCVDLAEGALALDSNFRMAHLYISLAYVGLGNGELGRQHIRLASAASGPVSERELMMIQGTDAAMHGNYDKAVEPYRRLTELYPDDIEGHRGLAQMSVWIGRVSDAVTSAQHVVQLNPRSLLDNARLMQYLNRANQFDEALAVQARCEAAGLRGPQLLWHAGVARWGQDDLPAARREFQRMAQSGNPTDENVAQLYESRLLIYEGRLDEAAQALRTGLVLDEKLKSRNIEMVRRYLLARVELLRARRPQAAAEMAAMMAALRARPEPADLRRAAVLAFQLNDARTLRELAALSEVLLRQQESTYTQSAHLVARGAQAALERKFDEALDALGRASDFYRNPDSLTLAAEIATRRSDWPAVEKAMRELMDLRGQTLTAEFPGDVVLAYRYLARAEARQGRQDDALRNYDEFLTRWRAATDDTPVVREVQQERDRLRSP